MEPVPKTKAWFTAQVIQHQAALFRVARAILSSDEDAEDAVQDAILSAYTRLDTLQDPAKFKPWLLRILVNQCYTLCRKERPTVDLSAVEDTLPAEGQDPAESLTLRQAVSQLPQNLRAAITLFYYEDYSVRQITRILSLSEAAVKTRLSRGREYLRRLVS